VNKWYQERSAGTWNLPGGQWTMFWTTDGITKEWEAREWELEGSGGMTRWEAYIDVCGGIVPSWDDGIERDD
jgi:amino-acid N-acetyltransferase